jgi:hypothetical protein
VTPDDAAKLVAGTEARKPGLGGCFDPAGPERYTVGELLSAGSARLALARALKIPFAPYFLTVRADFPSVDTSLVPSVGSKQKISQDTLIDEMTVRTYRKTTPTGVFDSLFDFFYNYTSGIEATLDIKGQPRPAIVEDFMPLSQVMDVVGGTHLRRPWILTYQQQLFMTFRAPVTIPFPLIVNCVFRAWLPEVSQFALTDKEAVDRLTTEFGIDCSGYGSRCTIKA